MRCLQSRRHTTAGVTGGEHDVLVVVMLGVVEKGLDSGLSEDPSTGVGGLFLTPDNGLGVRIRVEVLFELLPWEGEDLLDTGNGGVLEALVGTVFVERGVDLTRAEDHTVNVFRFSYRFAVLGFGDNPLELRVSGEVFNRRPCKRVTEERFREEDNKSYRMLADDQIWAASGFGAIHKAV